MDLDLVKLKYQELFCIAGEPKEHHLQVILLFHAFTTFQGLSCTGSVEDDIIESYELPPTWSKDIDGVYSLRYQTKDKANPETIYIKFVVEGDVLDINAVGSSNPGLMLSTTYKLGDIKESTYEKVLKQFKDEVISKILQQNQKKEESTQKRTVFEDRKEPETLLIPILRDQPKNTGGFGDYGKSDLRPLPLDPLGLGGLGGGIGVGGGSLLGPNNSIFTSGPKNPEVRGELPGMRIYPTGPGFLDPNDPDDDHLQLKGIPTKKPQGGFQDPFGGGFGSGNRFGRGGFGGGGGGFGGGFF